ncbi:MAG: hypothetical protein V1831_00885, partial [Candidatus Woesearchaeota archaeon]
GRVHGQVRMEIELKSKGNWKTSRFACCFHTFRHHTPYSFNKTISKISVMLVLVVLVSTLIV